MRQLFTRSTALLNLVVWVAALVGSIAGPRWLALVGWAGVLVVTAWTVLAAKRAGHDPFPDVRDGSGGPHNRQSADEQSYDAQGQPSDIRRRASR